MGGREADTTVAAPLRVDGTGAFVVGLPFALVMVVLLAGAMLGTSVPGAFAAPKGIVGFYGGTGTEGGQFSSSGTSPRGVAVRDATGDVYVVDTGSHRVQQFDSDDTFVRAWGFDVVSPGAAGSGDLTSGSTTVSNAVASTGAFLVGQRLSGTGIAAGTTIASVDSGTLTLSQAAVATGAATALTAASPGNADAFQSIVVKASSGQFRLSDGRATTGDIAFNASAGAVAAALNALPSVSAGGGSVTVTGGPGDLAGAVPYGVRFTGGPLAGSAQGAITTSNGSTPLAGGPATATATTINPGGGAGSGFEMCTVATVCKAGVNSVSPATGGELSNPQGIAIDQATGNIYVGNNALLRMEEFTATGTFVRAIGSNVVATGQPGDDPASSAVQRLTVDASGGTFRLTFLGQTTADLNHDVSAADLQAALEGLSSIGAGNVTVTPAGATGADGGGTPYIITFRGNLANNPEPLIAVGNGSSPLSGITGAATVVYDTPTSTGSNGHEICNNAAACQAGTTGSVSLASIGYPAVAPAGAPNAGNVLVGAFRRVHEYTASGALVRVFGYDVKLPASGSVFETCSAAAYDPCKAAVAGPGVGQFNATIGNPSPNRIAVDTDGVIYTLESSLNFRVQKFTPSGADLVPAPLEPNVSTSPALALKGTSAADSPSDIAVDSADNHVHVVKPCTASGCPDAALSTERRIYEFGPSPTSASSPLQTHLADYGVPASNGLAVKAGANRLYTTAAVPAPRVNVIGEPVPPSATIAPSTAIAARTATLHGTVNPNGGDPGLQTKYRFEVSVDGSDWTRVPDVDVDVGGGTSDIAVTQTVMGLEPNRHYQVRLVADKGGSLTNSTGNAGDFTTDPAAPTVETYPAIFDAKAGATILEAAVNPNNNQTAYYFEYGTEPCAGGGCQASPATKDASAGGGGEIVTVRQRIEGLQPDTTYHFRVVADNGVEASPGQTEVRGAERTIRIPPAQDSCPNAAFRTGPSALLADCMAYEWVSNADSWGVGILEQVRAVSADGDRALVAAQALGEPKSTPAAGTPYVMERDGGAWRIRYVTPDPRLAMGSQLGASFMPAGDLSGVLWPEATRAQRDRAEGRFARFDIDGTRTPASGYLTPIDYFILDVSEYFLTGVAGDLSSFTFMLYSPNPKSRVRLFADEPAYHGPNGSASAVYRVSGAGTPDPRLEIVNRESDVGGEPGKIIGGVCGAGVGGRMSVGDTDQVNRAVSLDGSVVYFSARPTAPETGDCTNAFPKRLYKREAGTTTAVSAPQCAGTCDDSGADAYKGASSSGEVVAFMTSRQLVDGDDDATPDLYVYDSSQSPTSRLSQASAGEDVGSHVAGVGARVEDVVDVSADGSRVYFFAQGVLSGPNQRGVAPVAGQRNLYVFERSAADSSERLAFVATLAPQSEDAFVLDPSLAQAYALPFAGGSGDGHRLVFTSARSLVSDDADSVGDVYRYDDTTGELECASCIGDGDARVAISPRPLVGATTETGGPVSDDGSTIAFTTAEPLLVSDENAVNDVYAWRDGALTLISGGAGGAGAIAAFSDDSTRVSADGRSVFFLTRGGISRADRNNVADLYVARIDGGMPEPDPPAAECQVLSDSCQGSGSGSVSSDPKTSSPSGGGNAAAEVRKTLVVSPLSKRARRRASRTGRLALSVRAPSAGMVSLTVEAKLGKKVTRVGRASKRASKAGRVRLSVRLSSAARKRLRSGRRLRLTAEVRQAGARMRAISILLPGVKS